MDTDISGLLVRPGIDRLADWLFRGAGGSVARLDLTPRGCFFIPIALTHPLAYIFHVAFFLAFAASGKERL